MLKHQVLRYCIGDVSHCVVNSKAELSGRLCKYPFEVSPKCNGFNSMPTGPVGSRSKFMPDPVSRLAVITDILPLLSPAATGPQLHYEIAICKSFNLWELMAPDMEGFAS